MTIVVKCCHHSAISLHSFSLGVTRLHDYLFHFGEWGSLKKSNVKMTTTTTKRGDCYHYSMKNLNSKSCLFSCPWTTTTTTLYSMLTCILHPAATPTTMALLMTDCQWFLCHLELIHNICDSNDGQCPIVMAFGSSLISIQLYTSYLRLFKFINVFMLLFFFCLFVCNVQNPRNLSLKVKMFGVVFFLVFFSFRSIAKYDRAVLLVNSHTSSYNMKAFNFYKKTK